jgi:signal transduction histidine kinase
VRILVVEDEHKLAGVLKRGLEEHGFAVDVAYDGEDGLALATVMPYDLLVLDIMLPNVDGLRLMQLLINLVDNALRYTPPGGRVTVEAMAQAGWAELCVADTGVGIAAEHVPHLFERFYRADPSRARSDGGSGLGLAIAQWIAHAHDGHIGVESEFGRGSRFTVRIRAKGLTACQPDAACCDAAV